jgi:hypothetical protein
MSIGDKSIGAHKNANKSISQANKRDGKRDAPADNNKGTLFNDKGKAILERAGKGSEKTRTGVDFFKKP